MKIGVVYPQTELRGDSEAVRTIGLRSNRWGTIICKPKAGGSIPSTGTKLLAASHNVAAHP
jgi:hypothetical protein